MRHTFVTLARQTGCPLEDVQDAVGHADPGTTRRYDRTLLQHPDHPGVRILTTLSGLTDLPMSRARDPKPSELVSVMIALQTVPASSP